MRCRLSLLTNSVPHLRVQMRGEGEVAGSQPMSTAVTITRHGAQINFGDLTPYLTNDLDAQNQTTAKGSSVAGREKIRPLKKKIGPHV
jgi:hypothetical protein